MLRGLIPGLCLWLGVVGLAQAVGAEEIVAKYGDLTLSRQELADEVARQMPTKSGATSPSEQDLMGIAARLLKSKGMAKEAEQRGLDKTPEVINAISAARLAILSDALIKQEHQNIPAPDLESAARDYYDTHRNEYVDEARIFVSHILFKLLCDCVSCDCIAERNAKAEKAKEALAMVRKTQDFVRLAREYSEDEKTAKSGGEIGWATRTQLVPEFADAAFALKPGEVSDIVTTRYGYHIIRLEQKIPAKEIPYEKAKSSILAKLRERYMKDELAKQEQKYVLQPDKVIWNQAVLKEMAPAPLGIDSSLYTQRMNEIRAQKGQGMPK